ncbi:hypothetical protein SAMD00023353_5800750 [Rosellinia necatrix]|uniref:Uncharacterized protein n=1 Tax=Rosellinia necatrix TaxID=77044 RepID=A0A1W2TRX5_ROSNE|nr:hypothetical protein SAMD00023353_5800750 [Rosellinia necatrix]
MATRAKSNESAVMDEDIRVGGAAAGSSQGTPFVSRTRSLSDGDGSQLSPSPFIVETSRRTSKDDSTLRKDRNEDPVPPVTPRRPEFPMHGLSLQVPSRDFNSPAQPSYVKQAPLSPKLDHSQIYASPTNILPRRSRGLDFSRAATSLHHSMLAEQSSPDSSPTIGGRAMNIPRRGTGDYGADPLPTSLRSMLGNHERMHISSSVGSANPIVSDSSSSCGDDEYMDDEMEDAILTTPQVAKSDMQAQHIHPVPWMPGGSPTINSLSSFRIRPRKQPKKKPRGLAALGFNAALSRSPPSNIMKEMRDIPMANPRRESISWAANQLHISGGENEERAMEAGDASPITPGRDGIRGVVRRVVTRRGNLLPKTKGFARIRAALAEEGAPIDSEVRREAEVIRQVRESDMDLEPRIPSGAATLPLDTSNIHTAQSSPKLGTTQDLFDDIPDDDLMSDSVLSGSFKQQAMKNSKGKNFWDTFSETGSINGTRITPPPPVILPRGSSSGMSEDINMDSPSMSTSSGNTGLFGPGTMFPHQNSDGQKPETPQPIVSATHSQSGSIPPTAAEITRRINSKRRREDDFDPNIFKRRAVSPGMSVHNSPIMQSPLQRDNMPWGSRPGSNHGGEKASGTPSENGSSGGNNPTNAGRPMAGAKGRVGFQGMTDTHDGLMRMSIE